MSSDRRLQDHLGSVAARLHLWPLLRIPRLLNECLPHRARCNAPSVSAYAVYRARNESHVLRIIRSLPRGSEVHLHALDHAATGLSAWTRGIGPGARMALLQSLMDAHPPQEGSHVLVFDDDVVFRHSTPARFVGLAVAAAFDLAQPAHGVKSTRSFRFNRVAWFSTARRTHMVEVGPILLISPRAQSLVLPFPGDSGMGFGLDVRWSALRSAGLELGVVDATPIRHLGAISSAYSISGELAHLESALQDQGLSSVYDLDEPLAGPTWRPWRVSPPWSS